LTDTLRSCMVAEEGFTFIALDASQIELRIVAHLSQDQAMLEDLKTGDLHMATAIRMYGWVEDEEEMKQRRYNAKQGNFADLYEASEFELANVLGCSEEEALAFQEERKRVYPRLYEWKDEMKAKAKEDGYVVSPLGRIRPLPELYGGSWKMREKAEKLVVNTIAQGMAVDVVKMAGLYLRRVLSPLVRFVLQVHDEWLLEVPLDLVEDTIAKCKELAWVFPQYPFDIKLGSVYSHMEEVI